MTSAAHWRVCWNFFNGLHPISWINTPEQNGWACHFQIDALTLVKTGENWKTPSNKMLTISGMTWCFKHVSEPCRCWGRLHDTIKSSRTAAKRTSWWGWFVTCCVQGQEWNPTWVKVFKVQRGMGNLSIHFQNFYQKRQISYKMNLLSRLFCWFCCSWGPTMQIS